MRSDEAGSLAAGNRYDSDFEPVWASPTNPTLDPPASDLIHFSCSSASSNRRWVENGTKILSASSIRCRFLVMKILALKLAPSYRKSAAFSMVLNQFRKGNVLKNENRAIDREKRVAVSIAQSSECVWVSGAVRRSSLNTRHRI